jgi:hypothetical protein
MLIIILLSGALQETVLQELEMLSDADYRQTMVEASDANRAISTIKKISGFWLDKSKKLAKRVEPKAGVEGVELQGIAISGPSSSAQLRSVPVLSSSAQLRKSAWQVNLDNSISKLQLHVALLYKRVMTIFM